LYINNLYNIKMSNNKNIIKLVIATILLIIEFIIVIIMLYLRFSKHDYDFARTLGYFVIIVGMSVSIIYPYGYMQKKNKKK